MKIKTLLFHEYYKHKKGEKTIDYLNNQPPSPPTTLIEYIMIYLVIYE